MICGLGEDNAFYLMSIGVPKRSDILPALLKAILPKHRLGPNRVSIKLTRTEEY